MAEKPPRNRFPREYFETPAGRKAHLGGGSIAWWHMGQRWSLGYREGTWSSSWYARIGWGKNSKVSMRFGEPDDRFPCDGAVVFSFEQALKRAEEICQEMVKAPTAFATTRGKYRRLPTLPPRDPYKVVHALMDYRERQISLGKRVDQDESIMRVSIVPHLGHVNVADLTTQQITDWLAVVLKTSPQIASRRPSNLHFVIPTRDADWYVRRLGAANRCIRVLKAAMQLAFENGHCDSDAAWKRIRMFRRPPSKPPRYLERDEIHRLVDACPPDLRKLVVAALLSGCRANELLKLRAGDSRKTLRRIIVTDDKTKKTRHVTLSREGKEFFDRISESRPRDEFVLLR